MKYIQWCGKLLQGHLALIESNGMGIFPPVNWMGKSTWSLSSQAIGLMAHCMQEEDKASFVPEVVGFFIGYWK